MDKGIDFLKKVVLEWSDHKTRSFVDIILFRIHFS